MTETPEFTLDMTEVGEFTREERIQCFADAWREVLTSTEEVVRPSPVKALGDMFRSVYPTMTVIIASSQGYRLATNELQQGQTNGTQ